jgi:hypothetical protein
LYVLSTVTERLVKLIGKFHKAQIDVKRIEPDAIERNADSVFAIEKKRC